MRHGSEFFEGREETAEIEVDVVIEPVMHDYIPFAVVRTKLTRVPPISIEGPIRKSSDLRPKIEPTVQEAEESYNQEENRWHHEVDDCRK